jgi:hypothetical protein
MVHDIFDCTFKMTHSMLDGEQSVDVSSKNKSRFAARKARKTVARNAAKMFDMKRFALATNEGV